MALWNLKIDDETDRLVRRHIAERGLQPGDLAAYVEQAVRKAVFWETVDARSQFSGGADLEELEHAITKALFESRK